MTAAPTTMTTRQLAEHYGVHRDTVYAWLERGWLGRRGVEWFLLGGKEYRFRAAARDFLEARSWETPQPPISGNMATTFGTSVGTNQPLTADGELDAFLAGQRTASPPTPRLPGLKLVASPQ